MPRIQPAPQPSASAPALSLTLAQPIRLLRARKPLRYPGYPVELVTPIERAIFALLLLLTVGCWWLMTPISATLAG